MSNPQQCSLFHRIGEIQLFILVRLMRMVGWYIWQSSLHEAGQLRSCYFQIEPLYQQTNSVCRSKHRMFRHPCLRVGLLPCSHDDRMCVHNCNRYTIKLGEHCTFALRNTRDNILLCGWTTRHSVRHHRPTVIALDDSAPHHRPKNAMTLRRSSLMNDSGNIECDTLAYLKYL